MNETRNSLIIVVLVCVIIAYMWVSGYIIRNDGRANAQVLATLERIEKRNQDIETRLKFISDSVNRSIQEIRASRELIGEIAERNDRSIEALGRSEDRLRELEAILLEVRKTSKEP